MSAQAMFEVLENRTLMSTALPSSPSGNSGSAVIVGKTLVIQGSDIADTIQVTAYFNTATIHFINADVDESASFNKSDYDRIQVAAGNGDDTVRVDASLPLGVTLHGDGGNDKLTVANGLVFNVVAPPTTDWANTEYPGVVYGDAGDDTLVGGAADMYGGEGHDTVVYSSTSTYPLIYDTYEQRWIEDYSHPMHAIASLDDVANDGVFGHDNVHSDVELVLGYQGAVIASSDGTPPLSPPASPPPPPPAVASTVSPENFFVQVNNHMLTVEGTTGNDRITIRHKVGDPSVLQIVRNGKISNFTFSDVNKIKVTAGNGNDFVDLRDIASGATILGGNGNDSIYGSDGADSIDGGRGDDYLCGMAGNDSITGGIGRDFIRGGEGPDWLFAHAGSDHLNKNKGDTIVNDFLG